MSLYQPNKKATMINDIRDFRMPYTIYGTQDLNNMINRYMRLEKYSRPTYKRLGFFSRRIENL